MKRLILFLALLILLLSACGQNGNVTFTAVVESVQERGIMIKTVDYEGFDRASVGYSEDLKLGFNLIEGQTVEITILPQVRESYPVQVTAVRIELVK